MLDEENNQNDSNNNNQFKISRKKRYLVFFLFCVLDFSLAMDQAAISGATVEIKEYYNLNDVQLGSLGSFNFFGVTIGCLVTILIINKFNRKFFLLLMTVVNSFFLFLTPRFSSIYLINFCRAVTGFTCAYESIYLPAWCDQFGIKDKRTLFLTVISISNPLGTIIGFVLGMMIGWINAFYIEIVINLALTVCFFITPNMYFSMNIYRVNTNNNNVGKKNLIGANIVDDIIKKNKKEKISLISNEKGHESDFDFKGENKVEKDLDAEEEDDCSVFEEMLNGENPLINRQNNYNSNDINITEESVIKISTFEQIFVCLKSVKFICSTMTLTVLLYIVAGIQFWANDYIDTTLKIKQKSKKATLYTVVSSTAPALGIILGGSITNSLGGYDKRHSIFIPLVGSFMVEVFANLVTCSLHWFVFALFLWFYLFCGSFILPGLNGIIISSVPKELSGSASGLSRFIYYLLGKFPAPNVYGYIKQHYNYFDGRLPMVCLLNTAAIGFIFMCVCVWNSYARKEESREYDLEGNKDKKNIEMGFN